VSDPLRPLAEQIIREAIEGIEWDTIMSRADDDSVDAEELEKRVRGAVVSITVPTASGCTCLGLQHRRECADWRMPW